MKTRTLILSITGGLLGAACFVALVLGITNLLARGPATNRGADLVRAEVPFGVERIEILADVPELGPIAMFGEIAPVAVDQPARPEDVKALNGPVVALETQKIAGPFTHGPLGVFLVHGAGAKEEKEMLTLQEGLERGLVTVHEGGISIDNRGDQALFIQGGDVIKGGTQDRVLPYDYLIPAGTKRFPVQAFCVEQGRSFPRAGEISTSFAVSSARLPTKELRMAAYRRSQIEVWNGVARLQDSLTHAVGGDVRARLSGTSLQLTLEHPLVENGAQEYLSKLIRTPDKSDDVLGMVVVINGKIISGDVYSSPELFQKFWPKLLKAAAIQAIAEGRREATGSVSEDSVRAFLGSSDSSAAFRLETGGLTHMLRREAGAALVFDTCQSGLVVHRSLLAR